MSLSRRAAERLREAHEDEDHDLSHLSEEQREEVKRVRRENEERRKRSEFRRGVDPTPDDNRPDWAAKPQPQVPTWSTQKDKDSRKYGTRLERPKWAKQEDQAST